MLPVGPIFPRTGAPQFPDMLRHPRSLCLLAFAVLAGFTSLPSLHAQIDYATSGLIHAQSFDALPDGADNTAFTWADNSTLPGWYQHQAGSTPAFGISNGGSAAGLLVMRASQNAEKALGSRTTGSTGNASYGLRLRNATGATLSQFQLTYDGEQWRVGTAPAKTLVVEYSLNATSLTTGTWTALPSSAHFTTPHHSAGTAAALDGNAAANRVANLSATVTGISWPANGELWIRWTDAVNNSGTSNHSYGIDNVRFSAGLPAAVLYSAAGSTLTQNFDTLPSGADNTIGTWTDSSTLTGWYQHQSGVAPAFGFSNGGSIAGLLVMRSSQGASDRALGSRTTAASTGTGDIRYGVRIDNATGAALDRFQLTYDGEQWRVGTAPAKTLVVEYSLDATSLTTGTWTALPSSAHFTTPHHSAGTAAPLDGNAAANRVADLSATVTGITWPAHASLWLRWTDTVNNGGAGNHSFGIDNLRFIGGEPATPPPPPRFPAGAAVLDVTQAPYNADPTGINDSTAAIQAAINAAQGPDQKRRTVYLPPGTYRLTNSLVAPQGWITLQGHGRDTTILRLDNARSGFTDPANPRPVFSTITLSASFSNVQFMCNVYDLTIDVGSGNPGAVGLRYTANNQGSVRDVLIRSSDPAHVGHSGIQVAASGIPGPALLKRVEVVGFEHGILLDNHSYTIIGEHLTLRNQRSVGVRNSRMIVSLRGLTSINSVPALQNVHADGLVTLLDSSLTGGSSAHAAIENSGHLFARNIATSGYQAALRAGATLVPGVSISEYISSTPFTLTGTPLQSLNLPIEETPEQEWDPPSTWLNVLSFGATNTDNTDDSAAIQAAIDAATPTNRTIYFPAGEYVINQTVVVRGHVRHLIGLQSEIRVGSTLAASTQPVFRLVDGAQPVVQIERFYGSWWNSRQRSSHWFRNERSQTTVLRNIFLGNGQAYIGTDATGKTFFEDFCSLADFVGTGNDNGVEPVYPVAEAQPQMIIGPAERVWARQLNLEARQQKLRVDGGSAWIFGFKTEQPGQIVENRGGASLEMLGAAILNRSDVDPAVPVFLNEQANLSLVGGELHHGSSGVPFGAIVRDGGATLHTASLPKATPDNRSIFRLPLYVSYGMDRPVVSVAVSSGPAREQNSAPGEFTFTRTGSTASPLLIAYAASGTATPGTDTTATLPGLLTIPAGAATAKITVTPVDDALPELDETLTLSVSASPDYYVSTTAPSATLKIIDNDILAPAAVAHTQPAGTNHSLTLTLNNPAPVPQTFAFVGPPGTGNPSFLTSNQTGGPVFAWEDISQTGRRVMNLDGTSASVAAWIPLGFPFPFYGVNRHDVNICTNGFINFGNVWNMWGNSALPNVNAPPNLIAWLWDDLLIDASAAVYIRSLPDRFIIQFDNLRHNDSDKANHRVTGQVILYPSGEFTLLYKSITGSGFSYTIGAQNADHTVGVTVYNRTSPGANYVTDNLAIHFRPAAAWVFTNPASVTVPANSASTLSLVLNSTGLATGSHPFTVAVSPGHPEQSAFTLPVSLTVAAAAAPSISASPANASVTAGQTASFTVAAAGSPTPTLQWQRASSSGGPWSAIPGATSATYAFVTSGADDGAWFRCVATNGSGTATSAAASLAVATPLTPRQSWRQTHFGTTANSGPAADDADPDGDGLPNLLEYALGGDPVSAASTPWPAVRVTNSGGERLALDFTRIADPALTYTVEASVNLTDWTTIWSSTGAGNVAGPVTITDTVVLEPATPRRFLRLRVSP